MDLSEARTLEEKRPVVVFSPHPLQPARERSLEYALFLPGETIGEYLERTGILARMGRQPFVLTVNGARVPASIWWTCRPKPGTLINLYAVVRGGGGSKKNPLGVIAMIALAVYAPGLGQALASSTFGTAIGLSASLATIGVIAAGGLVINSLFPPPKPHFPERAGRNESPTYSIQGGTNRVRRYEPFVKIVGAHRVVPDFGAIPYSEFEGEDQVGYYLFDYGYNDVDLSEHKIGSTLLTEFSGYTLQESGPDGKLTLFPANVDSIEGGALEPLVPVSRTGSQNTTRISVEIGGQLFAVTDEGDTVRIPLDVRIEYRAVGAAGWTALTYGAAMGEGVAALNADDADIGGGAITLLPPRPPGPASIVKRAPLRRTYSWLVPQGQYEVRVERLTAENPSPKAVAEIVWTQLRSYQPDTADYTGRKRLALKMKASALANGVLSQFSSMARAKCEVWNGAAWVTQHTANPAWWALDIIRGRFVNGLRVWGGGQPDSRTDIENLKAFGAWCDAQGLEANGVFDQQLSVWDMLSTIALNGRATPSWGTGKLGVVWDAPDVPVTAYFGMHNIVAGSFEIEYATETLADVVEVWFVDPEREWQRDFVRCTVPGASAAARVKRVDLPFCTKRALAAQWGNLLAAANAYRSRRYKWRMDWEAMPCSRGEVGLLSHDLASLDYSGRFVEGGDAATLRLPKKVPLYPGGAFVVIVRPDGTASAHAVAGGAGDTDTLTATPALPFDPWADPDHPPYDYRWHYGPTATPGRKVKIDGFKPVSERHVDLTAIDEVPAYYAAKDNPATSAPARPHFGEVSVTSLRLDEQGVRAGNGYLARVMVSWEVTGDYAGADLRLSLNGGPLEPLAQGLRARSYEFDINDDADVTVELVAWSSLGRLGKVAKSTVTKHIHFAALSRPSDIADFSLDGNAFRWTPAPEVDVVGYRIRYHFGDNRSVADAHELHEGLLPYSPKTFDELPAGLVTFMIFAVDAAGLESVTPAVIVKDLGDPDLDNVVEAFDFDALGYPGTLTACALSGGDLLADSTTDFYGPGTAPFYGAGAEPFYEADLYTTLVYETEAVHFPVEWVGSRMVLEHALEGENIVIEYRKGANQEPFYETGTAPFYGEGSEPFYGAAPDWKPWPGALTFENGTYQFRVTIGGGPVQGAVRELRLVIDVPDIDEFIPDFNIAPGGSRPALSKPFKAIKTIKATLEDDGGDAVTVLIGDKQIDPGPLLIARDAALASVAARADVHIRGH